MVILDTSFLYAYFNDQDAHHLKALSIAKELHGQALYFPSSVFFELLNLFSMRKNIETAMQVGKNLLAPDSAATLLKMDDSFLDETWGTFQKNAPSHLSLTDSSVLYVALEYGSDLITFDQALKASYERLK